MLRFGWLYLWIWFTILCHRLARNKNVRLKDFMKGRKDDRQIKTARENYFPPENTYYEMWWQHSRDGILFLIMMNNFCAIWWLSFGKWLWVLYLIPTYPTPKIPLLLYIYTSRVKDKHTSILQLWQFSENMYEHAHIFLNKQPKLCHFFSMGLEKLWQYLLLL